jgi:hypothetical protein
MKRPHNYPRSKFMFEYDGTFTSNTFSVLASNENSAYEKAIKKNYKNVRRLKTSPKINGLI